MRRLSAAVALVLVGGCMIHKPVEREPAVTSRPPPPETLKLFDCGERLAYSPESTPSQRACEVRDYPGHTEMLKLKKSTVTLRVPAGWEASYAGEAAWVGLTLDSRARIVVYPAENVSDAFFEGWYGSMLLQKDHAVSFPYWDENREQGPFLFRYQRDDHKLGVVYARTLSSGGKSGIVVHGLWPSEYDREFLPLALAVGDFFKVIR